MSEFLAQSSMERRRTQPCECAFRRPSFSGSRMTPRSTTASCSYVLHGSGTVRPTTPLPFHACIGHTSPSSSVTGHAAIWTGAPVWFTSVSLTCIISISRSGVRKSDVEWDARRVYER